MTRKEYNFVDSHLYWVGAVQHLTKLTNDYANHTYCKSRSVTKMYIDVELEVLRRYGKLHLIPDDLRAVLILERLFDG